jgi:hypothetical protein
MKIPKNFPQKKQNSILHVKEILESENSEISENRFHNVV